jgi:CheY-like chemotaxis protein
MIKTTAKPSAAPTANERGGEHVLVAEDDDMVRELVVQQLTSLGYRVSEALDGPTVLEIIRERSDIDLLFADLVMPGGISGRDLAEGVAQLRPGLPILFTSGYGEDSIVQTGQLDQGFELLQKPYRKHELARRLRQMFDG